MYNFCLKTKVFSSSTHSSSSIAHFARKRTNCCSRCCVIFFLLLPETVGLKDTTQVENLQDQALAMLRNHIESSSPSNTTRFGRLLMLLANLRIGNAHRIEKNLFRKNHWQRKNGKVAMRHVSVLNRVLYTYVVVA